MGKLLPNSGSEDAARLRADSVFVESVSASMRPVEAVIRELARSDVPVLLLAERGAGKHRTAQRIHELSRRNAHPLHWSRCSTMKPEDLDASKGNGNLHESAGTVFFDEIGELSAGCQLRLRDALLEEGRNGSMPRFICGSSRDLEVEVNAGRLREDLYYRISGVCLRLPPLRQRKEDIPLLMKHFLERYATEYHRSIPQLSAETQRLFEDHSWPGNLHELEAAARVLVALGDEQLAMGGLRALLLRPTTSSGNGNGISLKAASRAASHEAEKELILDVLKRTRWNRRRAAQELQISYKALLYKLKQIGYQGYGVR